MHRCTDAAIEVGRKIVMTLPFEAAATLADPDEL